MLRNALTASLVLAAPAALAIDLSPGPQAHAGATREAIDAVLRWIATGIEVTGVGIIVVGAIGATVVFLYGGLVSVGWPAAFRHGSCRVSGWWVWVSIAREDVRLL